MAIVTHPDGYLQITEGHNWQDVSDDGILQRIFRGWNERRLVAGLPLYWYGKNPNASILLGGDAQFTEFENPLTVPNPISTLEDARIYPGANLQNVAFWNKLIQDIRALERLNVAINVFGGEFWFKYQYNGNYQGNDLILVNREQFDFALGEDISQGDILAMIQINSILHALWFLQFYKTLGTNNGVYQVGKYTDTYSESIIDEDCSNSYNHSVNDWYINDSFFDDESGFYYYGLADGILQDDERYRFEAGFGSYVKEGWTQQALPVAGEFIFIGNTTNPATGVGGSYYSPTPLTPSPGTWTVGRFDMQQQFTILPNSFGFDANKSPFETLQVNCGNLANRGYEFSLAVFVKPQFADLPQP